MQLLLDTDRDQGATLAERLVGDSHMHGLAPERDMVRTQPVPLAIVIINDAGWTLKRL